MINPIFIIPLSFWEDVALKTVTSACAWRVSVSARPSIAAAIATATIQALSISFTSAR
jgi:hypothetical protein